MKRSFWIKSYFFLFVFLLVGSTNGIAKDKNTLVIGMRGDAVTMDPHGRSESTNVIITSHMFSALVQTDKDMNVIPHLAESWDIVNDQIFTFYLRKGMKFTNGEPFNAAAAKYSIERAGTHPTSQMKHYVVDHKEIKVIDEYTLRFVTTRPNPDALQRFEGINMVAPKYYKSHKDTYLAKHPVGLGPYIFKEWVKDERIVMTRNPNWYHPLDFETIVFKPIPEGATRVAALISGEIDVCENVPIPDIPRITKHPRSYVLRTPSMRVIYLMFDVHNTKGGPAPNFQPGLPKGASNPFKNPKVRQAIAHAVNVEEIIEYVMEGGGYPATELIPAFVEGYNPKIKRAEFNPKLARKLLADAGYPNGFTANFDAPNDRYINDKLVAEAIAGQLLEVNINLNTITQPKAVFFPKVKAYKSPMFMAGWADESWAATMNRFFRVKTNKFGRNNRGRLNRPDLEKKIDTAEATLNAKKKIQLRQEVGAEFYGLNYILPLYYQENVMGVAKHVDAVVRQDEHIHAWNFRMK